MPRPPILPLIDWKNVFENGKSWEDWLETGSVLAVIALAGRSWTSVTAGWVLLAHIAPDLHEATLQIGKCLENLQKITETPRVPSWPIKSQTFLAYSAGTLCSVSPYDVVST